ncbi:MAG: TolB family protein, partial [Gemmatimonadaceae bacterium]
AAALLLFAAIGASGWLRPREQPFTTRYALLLRPNEAVASNLLAGRVAISPDGRRIIYVGRGTNGVSRLWMKDANQVSPTVLTGTDGATSPFFSPDGRQVGFVKDGRTVRTLSLEGGSPLTLTDSANATAADWGSDGYVYFETENGIARIRSTGGRSEPVFTYGPKDHTLGTEWPVVLPGARGLLFRRRLEGQSPADYEIMVMPLPKGEAHVLLRGIYARYSPTGHLVVVTSDGKLLVVPFNLRKLALSGAPVSMYEGLESEPFSAAVALSTTGTLVYATAGLASGRELVWVARDGAQSKVDSTWKTDGSINNFALSPDGKSIAVEVIRNAKTDIWVKELPAGPFSRITFGDTSFFRPSWMPDGKHVLFLSDRGDGAGIPFVKRADGVGTASRVSPTKKGIAQAFESADGRWLILRTVVAENGNGDIYGAKTGDTSLVPLVTSPARDGFPALSPDGKWLAYSSDESGAFETYVRPFPDVATARWQVSTAGGTGPIWSHRGDELFYRDSHGALVAAQIKTSPSFTVVSQRVLFSLDGLITAGPVQPYTISPDDKHFLFAREATAGEAGQLIVSEHWFEELNSRAQR